MTSGPVAAPTPSERVQPVHGPGGEVRRDQACHGTGIDRPAPEPGQHREAEHHPPRGRERVAKQAHRGERQLTASSTPTPSRDTTKPLLKLDSRYPAVNEMSSPPMSSGRERERGADRSGVATPSRPSG